MSGKQMTADEQPWRDWVGRSQTQVDPITAKPLAALWATLDRDDALPVPGTELPPLAHWVYFTPLARQSELGPDGHPRRGSFLPPVPLPRRMWAGGRLEFLQPLRVGDEATRHSQISSVSSKSGASGALVFVTVRHEVKVGSKLALTEEHDIVYRQAPAAGIKAPAPQPAPTDEAFARAVVPDPVLLFRYSALTFNGHRIHYDRRYVVEVEGYPGLVVHGPLIATLLLDLLRRERAGIVVRQFRFRAMAPLFDLWPFTLCGRPDGDAGFALWARGPNGELAMSASAGVG